MIKQRPKEHDYASYVVYGRALENYCDALERHPEQPAQDSDYWYFRCHETLNKLNSVLAQPEQKPVAWMYISKWKGNERFITHFQIDLSTYKAEKVWPLYTSPPRHQPLTNEQMELLIEDMAEWSQYVEVDTAPQTLETHVRQVLAAHDIREKP
jgi:hypothetical protein